MKLLYISNLTGNLFAGPNHSVPAQVAAQSKYDDVFWLNLNENEITNDTAGLLHKLSEVKGEIPDSLPEPFNKPDLVVFEEFYCYPFNQIVYNVIKKKIPYVIIPRSQMTWQGKQTKRLKKLAADILFFNRFAGKAAAVHYLTQTEKKDSSAYKAKALILPNGIHMPQQTSHGSGDGGITISYVGRLNIFQKGIDLLLDACGAIREQLTENKVRLCFYGPDQEGALAQMEQWRSAKNLENVVQIHGSVFAQEKAQVLVNSDLFIMTSRFEGMPMGLIEALSYGVPCIVTPGTNMMEEIVSSGAGYGCELTAAGIAEGILTALRDRENWDEKRSSAAALAKKYSWDGIARQTHDAYEKLLKEKR